MKNKLCLVLILLLGSCKPTKSVTEYKEVIKIDTFIREQIRIIKESVNDTLYLPSPCDSLGNVIPVVYTNNIIRYRASKSGVLLIVNQKKIVDSTLVEKTKTKDSAIQTKEIIKNVIPWWIWVIMILELILILLLL